MGMGHKDAKTFELIFSIEEVLSRSILTILCFKLMYKKQQLCSILLKMVLNQQFWILFATLCACEVRFSIILTDKDDLTGSEIEIDQPTIIFYMIDAAVTTLLVGILNFVKLQDLAKDNISEPNKVLKRIKTIDVTKKGLVKLLLKSVLFIFWLQFFAYFLLQIALITFYVFDVEKVSVGEDRQKAYSVLTRFGELAFLRRVSGYLWDKLFDDDNCYLGSRAKQTDEPGEEASEPCGPHQQDPTRGSYSNGTRKRKSLVPSTSV